MVLGPCLTLLVVASTVMPSAGLTKKPGNSNSEERERTYCSSECRRVPAHDMTEESLAKLDAPTIITGVLHGAAGIDWTRWTRAYVMKTYGNLLAKPLRDELLDEPENQTIAQFLDDDTGTLTSVFMPHQRDQKHLLEFPHEAELQHVPDLYKLLRPTGKHIQWDGFHSTSLALRGRWDGMHQHWATFFTVVTGCKGFVFAPLEAFPNSVNGLGGDDVGVWDPHPVGPREVCNHFGVKTQKQIRNISDVDLTSEYYEGGLESGAIRNATHCCSVHAGESVFWPSGWWHGTCGLDDWNLGFAVAGPTSRDPEFKPRTVED